MDVALQNAMARRDAAFHRVTEIDRDIESLREARTRAAADADAAAVFIRMWYEMAGIQPPPAEEQIAIDSNVPSPPSTPKRPKNPDRDFVVSTCLDIIREVGHPVGRHQLFETLTARGINIYGKDPEMVLSTMLWRSQDRIVRLPNFGYWGKDVQYPLARYYPLLEGLLGESAIAAEPEDGSEAEDYEE